MWNLERIGSDNSLKKEYGLKNMKEIWKVQSTVSRIRGNARELLSGNVRNPSIEKDMISNLSKLGIVTEQQTVNDILELKEALFLNRRLQSIVFRKGLARSMKQARQLIVHGFIAVNGKRVNKPGYMVSVSEENSITYYKQIDVTPPAPVTKAKNDEGSENAEVEAAQSTETEAAAASASVNESVEESK